MEDNEAKVTPQEFAHQAIIKMGHYFPTGVPIGTDMRQWNKDHNIPCADLPNWWPRTKKIEVGDTLAVRFKRDKYLDFINHCFADSIISGVDVKIEDAWNGRVALFVRISACGIDKIDKAIFDYDGEEVC